MGDPLTLKEKLKDPEHNNWLKAVLILREIKVGISSFVEDRCREAQEDVLRTVLHNLPPHVTAVPQCTTCTRTSLPRNVACPQSVCPFIWQEINRIHRNKRIQLSCTDVSAWTDTSRCWEFAKTFIMGEGYGDKRSAADTDCAGLLSIIINCVWIHTSLTEDMGRTPTVFHEVKNLRNEVMHSPDNRLSHALLHDLIKACVQILDDPKILAADPTAIAARERIKEIEGMLLTVSNVDYPSVFLEVEENLRQEMSEMKTNMAELHTTVTDLGSNISEQEKKAIDLAGKQTSQDKNISDIARLQALQEEDISDLARLQALQGNELQGRVGVMERDIEQLQKTTTDSWDQLGAAELKADIIKGYQQDLATVLETSWYDGVSAIHMFSPIIIREDLENQFSDNSPVRQGTSSAASIPILHHSGEVEPITSYRDIFFKDGQLQRTIVLLGEAGVGKTTFCNHIVNLWCLVQTDDCQRDLTTNDQALIGILKQFEYLFVVRCRDTKVQTSVLSMIKEMFCSGEDKIHIDNIFRYKTKQCLVIIDGLDEWLYTSSVGQGKNSLHVLPDCNEIRGATVLMTSRPWKVEVLPRNSFLGYRVLQIEGLDWLGILTVTQKFIKALEPTVTDHETLCENFLTQVKQQQMGAIVIQPLLLFSIIESWLLRNHKLHRSRTMNYAGLINSVLSHSDPKLSDKDKKLAECQSKQSLPGCFTEMKRCLTHSGSIRKISALAFKTLVLKEKGRSLVFSKKDLIDEVGEDCLDLCLKLGILSETKASSLARVKHVTISFIHKSVQEYFAAVHLSEDEAGLCLTQFTNKLTSLNEVFELELILIFLCGMSPSKGQTVLNHVYGVVDQCSEIKAYRQCADSGESGYLPDILSFSSSVLSLTCRKLFHQLYVRCAVELKHTVVSPTSQHTSSQPILYIPDVLIDLHTPDDELDILFCPGDHVKSLAYVDKRETPCHVVESLKSMTNIEKLVVMLSNDHVDKHIYLIIQSLPHMQQLQAFRLDFSRSRNMQLVSSRNESETNKLSVLQTTGLFTELVKLTNLVSVALSCLDLTTVEKVEFPKNLNSVYLFDMIVTSDLFACMPTSCTTVNLRRMECTGDLVFPSTCTRLKCYKVACLGKLIFPSVCTTLTLSTMSLPDLSVIPDSLTSLDIITVTLSQSAEEQLCRFLRSPTLHLQRLTLFGKLTQPLSLHEHLDLSSCLSLEGLKLGFCVMDSCGVLVPRNVRTIFIQMVTMSEEYLEQLVHNIYTCHKVEVILNFLPMNEATLKYIYQHFIVLSDIPYHTIPYHTETELTDESNDKTDEKNNDRTDEKNDKRDEKNNHRTDKNNHRTDEKENDRTDENEKDRTDVENNDRTEKENDRTDEKNNDRTDEKVNYRTDEKKNDITDGKDNNKTDRKTFLSPRIIKFHTVSGK